MSFVLLGILNSQAAGAPAGAGDYDLLETTVLGSDTASVSFTGLGSYTDYKHLQVRFVTNNDSSYASFACQFNADTTASYSWHRFTGEGASGVLSDAGTSDTKMLISIHGAGVGSDIYSAGVMDILDFSDTSKNTTIRTLNGDSNFPYIGLFSGLYQKTNAITSIEFFDVGSANISSGSRFSLYGLKETV